MVFMKHRRQFLSAFFVAVLLLTAGLAAFAERPAPNLCFAACQAEFDVEINACIFNFNPALTWGECHHAAMMKYQDCTRACQRK